MSHNEKILSKDDMAKGLANLMKELPFDVMGTIVATGEAEFVKRGLATDRYGLSRDHYRKVFASIARKVKRLSSTH